MRTLAVTVVLGSLALVVAGCSSSPAAAPTSRTPTPTPTVTPLAIPSAHAGEIVRSTFEQGVVDTPSAQLPATAALSIDVECSGRDGSTMRWALQGADGSAFGPSGVQDCTGPSTTSGLGIAGDAPARIRVTITPGPGVTAGYAIVRQDSP